MTAKERKSSLDRNLKVIVPRNALTLLFEQYCKKLARRFRITLFIRRKTKNWTVVLNSGIERSSVALLVFCSVGRKSRDSSFRYGKARHNSLHRLMQRVWHFESNEWIGKWEQLKLEKCLLEIFHWVEQNVGWDVKESPRQNVKYEIEFSTMFKILILCNLFG